MGWYFEIKHNLVKSKFTDTEDTNVDWLDLLSSLLEIHIKLLSGPSKSTQAWDLIWSASLSCLTSQICTLLVSFKENVKYEVTKYFFLQIKEEMCEKKSLAENCQLILLLTCRMVEHSDALWDTWMDDPYYKCFHICTSRNICCVCECVLTYKVFSAR